MSTVREGLAAAASSVEGVNVQPYYRQSPKAGDGWVSFAGLNRDDTGFSFMDAWELRIVTHADLAASDKWIEENGDALLAAMHDHLIVTSLAPVTFQLDAGNVPGLLISGVRPHPEGNETR